MQETLAAACLMAMHWDGKTPFLSPMCGSGTPAIEAAMIAMNRAPGLLKGHFAFQSIKGYNRIIPGESAPLSAPRQRVGATPEQIWKDMVVEAKSREIKENLPRIVATDISPEAVENAHTNSIVAGVSQMIEFKACDFADSPVPQGKGRFQPVRSGADGFPPGEGFLRAGPGAGGTAVCHPGQLS